MIQTFDYKDTKWLDMESPTKEDVDRIISEYHIDPITARELILPTNSPSVEFYKNYLHIVLHFPTFKSGQIDNPVQEVDFILTDKALITARFDHFDVIHKFGKKVEADAILEKGDVANASSYLFFRLLRELYGSLFGQLAFIDSWTTEIEKNIFKSKEHEMVFAISHMSRALIDLERTLSQHKDVLETLKEYGSRTYGEYFEYHAQAVINEYSKLRLMVHNRRDIVSELRDTNNSLLSSKQNEASKILAALALIAVPMSLIISVFQINTQGGPLLDSNFDFVILIGIILAIGAVLFGFFKYKKWL